MWLGVVGMWPSLGGRVDFELSGDATDGEGVFVGRCTVPYEMVPAAMGGEGGSADAFRDGGMVVMTNVLWVWFSHDLCRFFSCELFGVILC